MGGFGARLGSREGSRGGSSRLWCRAMQVRFNRVLKNVPVKVRGGFGAEPGQEKVPEKVWEALVQSQGRFRRRFQEALVQSQVRFNRICGHLIHAKPVEAFPALGFAARFRQILKIKRCGCWGYHRSLFFSPGVCAVFGMAATRRRRRWLVWPLPRSRVQARGLRGFFLAGKIPRESREVGDGTNI